MQPHAKWYCFVMDCTGVVLLGMLCLLFCAHTLVLLCHRGDDTRAISLVGLRITWPSHLSQTHLHVGGGHILCPENDVNLQCSC